VADQEVGLPLVQPFSVPSQGAFAYRGKSRRLRGEGGATFHIQAAGRRAATSASNATRVIAASISQASFTARVSAAPSTLS
jgi:hypothetical protein